MRVGGAGDWGHNYINSKINNICLIILSLTKRKVKVWVFFMFKAFEPECYCFQSYYHMPGLFTQRVTRKDVFTHKTFPHILAPPHLVC